MGVWLSTLSTLFSKQEARVLVLGLDNAGDAPCRPCHESQYERSVM